MTTRMALPFLGIVVILVSLFTGNERRLVGPDTASTIKGNTKIILILTYVTFRVIKYQGIT